MKILFLKGIISVNKEFVYNLLNIQSKYLNLSGKKYVKEM